MPPNLDKVALLLSLSLKFSVYKIRTDSQPVACDCLSIRRKRRNARNVDDDKSIKKAIRDVSSYYPLIPTCGQESAKT